MTVTRAPGAPPRPASDTPVALRRPLIGRLADRGYLVVSGTVATLALALVVYLIYVTWRQTGPVWDAFGVWGFITGREWIPAPVEGDPIFGALPFIYGTAVTSAIAMVIAVPLAIGIALATTTILPSRVRGPVAAVINLLAAVPSVVFGFWGLVTLVPAARPGLEWVAAHNLRFLAIIAVVLAVGAIAASGVARAVLGAAALALAAVIALTFDLPGPLPQLSTPFGLLEGPVLSGSYILAGIVLGVMVLPVITAICREVLATVPRDQQEAAYALGATRWEMIRYAMLPWARSGIVGASALGLGRALGETIALAMVLGNVATIGGSLLGPGYTAAGVIAMETGESGDLQLAALTALGLVLFAITFLINLMARALVRREGARVRSHSRTETTAVEPTGDAARPERVAVAAPLREIVPVSRERRLRGRVAETAIVLAVVVGAVPLVMLLLEAIREGLPLISSTLFTADQPLDPNNVAGHGIRDVLIGTLVITGIATAIVTPLAIFTAVFIHEAHGRGGVARRVGDAMGMFVDVLLGMPSIMAGLTVYLAVVVATERFSALAGALAMAIVMFPIIVRSADEVLRLVPRGHTEAAQALGAPRWRTMWSVVLPAAAPGILTGVVLAIARATGETAPLLFTSLGSQVGFQGLLEPIGALAQFIFSFTIQVRTEQSVQFAWAATLVLVSYILLLTVAARVATRLTTNRGGA